MTGKERPLGATAAVSTGGSLISDARLQQLYTTMLRCRLLTEHAARQRGKTRSVRPFAASMGQEALAAGWVIDLRPEDSIALAAGDALPCLVKGVPLEQLIAPLYAGRSAEEVPYPAAQHVIPALPAPQAQCDAIVATAFASKRKKKGNVVVVFASTPVAALAPWQDMLTLARKKNLPIVFIVENNPWHERGSIVEHNDDFTQKARDYGLTGISVDGNDVVAVYRVAFESLDRVRHGDGPVMVEGRTYHDSGRSKHAERDPLLHMERYLKAKKLFPAGWKNQLQKEFLRELKSAVKAIGAS
jgi:TPP-dependent pyruvate/acetoin dehydrogenase alpha subunit